MKLNQKRNLRTASLYSMPKDFQIYCGKFFKNRRIQADMTEEAVATYLGVGVLVLNSYESGTSPIPLSHVHALSNCLNIAPNDIMELFHDLGTHIQPRVTLKQSARTPEGFAATLRAARETAAMSSDEVVDFLTKSGYPITASELLSLENGESEPSIEFWIYFCRLVSLPFDSVYRYSRAEHLSNIRIVSEREDSRTQINFEAMKALREYQIALEQHQQKMMVLFKALGNQILRSK